MLYCSQNIICVHFSTISPLCDDCKCDRLILRKLFIARLLSEHHACCCVELKNHAAPYDVNLKPQLSSELRLSITSQLDCLYAFVAELT
mmetsp:Transcript_28406/g.42422  ORF Transcript_28406/g.42422 Transcript_28406/m.42422 type:complete len:89 (+) Transcript_28406:239-505(+)